MDTREKLIELLKADPCVSEGWDCVNNCKYAKFENCFEERYADHLIANGVTVNIKKEKPPTDLTNKCGSCVYASSEAKECWLTTPSYLRCVNPTKRWHRKTAQYKARTTKACKCYKAKENDYVDSIL